MGYGLHFPAHQVGESKEPWVITGYGLSRVWIMAGSAALVNELDQCTLFSALFGMTKIDFIVGYNM